MIACIACTRHGRHPLAQTIAELFWPYELSGWVNAYSFLKLYVVAIDGSTGTVAAV